MEAERLFAEHITEPQPPLRIVAAVEPVEIGILPHKAAPMQNHQLGELPEPDFVHKFW